jgi:alpha-mannosidase
VCRSIAAVELSWEGEMRSAARANVLAGVTSTRIDSKIAGGRAERALERYAEPLAALHGGDWPGRLLELAWARLIDNSAHDSICSCSLDEVVEQVRVRYAEAEQIARGITDRVAARLGAHAAAGSYVALNPSPHERSAFVELDIVSDAAGELALQTGDGSLVATQQVRRAEQLLLSRRVPAAEATGPFTVMHGRELFGRLLNACVADRVDGRHRLTFHIDVQADPPSLDVDQVRAEAEAAVAAAPDEPWEVRILGRARRTLAAIVPAPALGATALTPVPVGGALDDRVAVGERTLSNGLVAVTVDADGTLALEGSGARLTGVARLVDEGDAGDSYNYGPPARDRLVEEPEAVDVEVLAGGPVRGTLHVRRTYRWPVGLTADRTARSDDMRLVVADTTVELRAGEPFVRLDVAFDNPCDDHRVRLHVPLPDPVEASHAAGQFGVAGRGLDV